MDDIKIHYGTCDYCKEGNILVVHYNSKQLTGFRLCIKCHEKGAFAMNEHINAVEHGETNWS